MNVCDVTNGTFPFESNLNETVSSDAIDICVNTLGAVASLMVFVVVLWTPSLQGTTGSLLLNAQVVSFIGQLQVAAFTLASPVSVPVRLVNISLTRSVRFASSLFLALMNINMYLAVCRSRQLKVTLHRGNNSLMIVVAWSAIVIFWLMGLPGRFYSSSCVHGVLTIGSSTQGKWIPLVSVACAVIPMVCNFVCLWRVSNWFSTLPSNLTFKMGQDRKLKLMKVKLMYVITFMSAILLVPLVTVNCASEFAREDLDFILNKITSAFWLLNNFNEISRLIIYFFFYRPMWEAVKGKFCSATSNKVKPFHSLNFSQVKCDFDGLKLNSISVEIDTQLVPGLKLPKTELFF